MTLLLMEGFDDTALPSNAFSRGTGHAIGRDGIGQCASQTYIGGNSSYEISLPSLAGATVFHAGIAVRGTGNITSNYVAIAFENALAGTNQQVLVDQYGRVTFLGHTSDVNVAPVNSWNFFEVKVTAVDASHISGTVKVNGRTIITAGSFAVPSSSYAAISLPYAGGGTTYFDDLYITDNNGAAPYNDSLGDCFVRTMLPDGNGNTSQFTNSAGTSVNNYTYVDSKNSQSALYVGAATAGLEDLYTIGQSADAIPTDYIVYATQGIVYAGKSDAGAPPNLSFYSSGLAGGNRVDSVQFAQAITYQLQNGDIHTTDPDGNPLTHITVNGMQIGIVTS